jgi:cytoskeletal protein CcmA (bactofilin family)
MFTGVSNDVMIILFSLIGLLMFKKNPKKLLEDNGTSFEGIVPSFAVIEGILKITKPGCIRIEGLINGGVIEEPSFLSATEGAKLYVTGKITGNISAKAVIIDGGSIIGDITATYVILKGDAAVTGNITYEYLSLALGSSISGKLTKVEVPNSIIDRDIDNVITKSFLPW